MIHILSDTVGRGHGAERILALLLEEWTRVNEASNLTIHAPKGSYVIETAENLNVRTVPVAINSPKLLQINREFLKTSRRHIQKGAHIHAWCARSFEPSVLLAKLQSCTISGTLHDHPCASFHSPLRQRIIRTAANRMHSLVCVSDAVANACSKEGYKTKLTTIHNGLPPAATTEKTASERVRVGFLGAYASWKGHKILFDWMQSPLLNTRVKWQLYGDPTAEFRQGLEQLNIPQSAFTLHGHTSPDEIFDSIDVLVHPSTEFDPFPTALLEAARAGIPAISSDVGGANEIIEHAKTGFTFPLDDTDQGLAHLMNLSENPDLRKTLGLHAKDRFFADLGIACSAKNYQTFWAGLQ